MYRIISFLNNYIYLALASSSRKKETQENMFGCLQEALHVALHIIDDGNDEIDIL